MAGTFRDSIARAEAGITGIRRVVFFYLARGITPFAWKPSVALVPDNKAETARLRGEIARWDVSVSRTKLRALVPAGDGDKLEQVMGAFRIKKEEALRRLTRLENRPNASAA